MGKKRQQSLDRRSICERLQQIRQRHYGPRGKSQFARDLAIPVTTYQHYEAGRMPPPDLLVRASRLTGTDLEWLLCGDEAPLARTSQQAPAKLPSPEPVIAANGGPLIPVIGSTAAGTARYWAELETTHGGPAADARLEQVLSAHWQRTLETPSAITNDDPAPVALVQYSQPQADGFLEFLSAPSLAARYPHAVAWRIDGESMSPRYQDGDLVITSPDHPAVEMHPCVARQVGQIGVNCKLYQRQGDEILLIPIHPDYEVQRVPSADVRWAWRVLSSVRLQQQ